MFSKSTTTHPVTAALLALSLAFTAAACDATGPEAPSAEMGTVQLALTSIGTDGDTYRLAHASLYIAGPTEADVNLDETFAHGPVFEATVDVGEYTISLADGWTLQRHDGEAFVDVAATMTSSNPTNLTVERDATTAMALVFETANAEIEFATGDLQVWLMVMHHDCEPGETVLRSCGANLTGRQFRACGDGWWQDWSECSQRCNQGYCLFMDPETFRQATMTQTVETVGFETYATGSPVPADIFAAVYGDVFSDAVNFVSVGASNQMFPWDSDMPFIGQKGDAVVIHGGEGSGEATLRSSAGAHNSSGFDAIEAIFPSDAFVTAAAIAVEDNEAGFDITVHNQDCDIVSRLPVTASDGTNFIVLGNPDHHSFSPASSIVVTPGASDGSPHGTASWAMTEFSYAY